MKLLILGSCGFLGAHLTRYFAAKKDNYNISQLDGLFNQSSINNRFYNKGQRFYLNRIGDEELFSTIFEIEQPDVVINTIQSLSILDVKLLIKQCKNYKFKLIFYTNDLDKLTFFEWEKELSECYNLITSSTIFGPRQNKEKISLIIKSIFKNENVLLPNQGLNTQEYTFVDDFVLAIDQIINEDKCGHYHISSKHEFNDLELYFLISKLLKNENSPQFFNEDAKKQILNFRDEDLLKLPNWKPGSFQENLKKTIQWFQNNQWFFKN